MNQLGVFETISIENGKAIFLEKHLERIENALIKMDINNKDFKSQVNISSIYEFLKSNPMSHGALKIIVTKDTIEFSKRENPYSPIDYERGFIVDYAKKIRDESSPFTYVKSINNSLNLLEKSEQKKIGIDEPIFLNSKGELTEGAVTNIFFVKQDKLYTPKIKCGLLDGILRGYLVNKYDVRETIILPEDISSFDEMFVTNSLMGIMPVNKLGINTFPVKTASKKLLNEYRDIINKLPHQQILKEAYLSSLNNKQ